VEEKHELKNDKFRPEHADPNRVILHEVLLLSVQLVEVVIGLVLFILGRRVGIRLHALHLPSPAQQVQAAQLHTHDERLRIALKHDDAAHDFAAHDFHPVLLRASSIADAQLLPNAFLLYWLLHFYTSAQLFYLYVLSCTD
jgi:hypothetical protein